MDREFASYKVGDVLICRSKPDNPGPPYGPGWSEPMGQFIGIPMYLQSINRNHAYDNPNKLGRYWSIHLSLFKTPEDYAACTDNKKLAVHADLVNVLWALWWLERYVEPIKISVEASFYDHAREDEIMKELQRRVDMMFQ